MDRLIFYIARRAMSNKETISGEYQDRPWERAPQARETAGKLQQKPLPGMAGLAYLCNLSAVSQPGQASG